MNTFVIATDLQIAKFVPNAASKRREAEWKPWFFSKRFTKEHEEITFDAFKLKENKLLKIGAEITQQRKQYEVLAQNLTESR